MEGGVIHILHVLEFQLFGECCSGDGFTMHEEDLLHRIFGIYRITRQQILASMAGESADRGNLRLDVIRFTENLDALLAVCEPAT